MYWVVVEWVVWDRGGDSGMGDGFGLGYGLVVGLGGCGLLVLQPG